MSVSIEQLPNTEAQATGLDLDAAFRDSRVGELLQELDRELVGLAPVKSRIRDIAALLLIDRLRRSVGLTAGAPSLHMCFTGNPGTGKTTVARLVGQLYRTLGVVAKGQVVETDRPGLVAGYVGQTAPRVQSVAESAFGGVLLIDEAYALARGSENDFGREAIDTLVKLNTETKPTAHSYNLLARAYASCCSATPTRTEELVAGL